MIYLCILMRLVDDLINNTPYVEHGYDNCYNDRINENIQKNTFIYFQEPDEGAINVSLLKRLMGNNENLKNLKK